MTIKTLIGYFSRPSAFAFYQLLIISLLGYQVQGLLKTALTNPEGIAIILKSIPVYKSNSLVNHYGLH